jgi:hypothetical protein
MILLIRISSIAFLRSGQLSGVGHVVQSRQRSKCDGIRLDCFSIFSRYLQIADTSESAETSFHKDFVERAEILLDNLESFMGRPKEQGTLFE